MSQMPLIEDRDAKIDRVVAELIRRFPCYGSGTSENHRNPLAVTLANQAAQFAFGVKVRDVVEVVVEMAEAEP